MLSLASLLNPAPPGGPPPPTPRYRPSPALSSPAPSYSSEVSPSLMYERHTLSLSKPPKMTKDITNSGFVKSRAKGTVNYPPHEILDEASLEEIRRYQIYPFGRIQEFCRHIPYNSGKKDFLDKTGRESFEVFQYTFKVPGEDIEYTVMWDYNVGLVRMTPFFKCCKYSKTQPAKMLGLNPGLRDITHSITGGSIMAQGYWMPFICARAVCATFCASIAGALIPIFGPRFPLQCTPLDSSEHGRMVIDQALIAEATREAELYRRMYANANSVNENSQLPHQYSHYNQHHHQQHHYYNSPGPALPSPTSIPSPCLARPALMTRYGSPHDYEQQQKQQDHHDAGAYEGYSSRLRLRGPDSPYGTASEPELHTGSGPETPSSLHSNAHRGALFPPLSPPRSSGWTVINNSNSTTGNSTGLYHHGSSTYRDWEHEPSSTASPAPPTLSYTSNAANPLLSAVPRFGGHGPVPTSNSSCSSPTIHSISNSQNDHHGRHRLHLPPLGLAHITTTPTNNGNGKPSPLRTRINNTAATWSIASNMAALPSPQLHNSASNPSSKRSATDVFDEAVDYDDDDNHSGSSPTTTTTTVTSQDETEDDPHHSHRHRHRMVHTGSSSSAGADKNAALMLLNLSVRDGSSSISPSSSPRRQQQYHHHHYSGSGNGSGVGGATSRRVPPRRSGGEPESMSMSPVVGAVGGHRNKRRRATSM